MRRILLLTLLLATVLLASTDVSAIHPPLLSVQGRLTDPAGSPLAGTYSVQFKIWYDSTGGTYGYLTTQSVTTDVQGLFATVLPGADFTLGLYNDTSLYLGIQVGADPEMAPRTRLTAVPYSLRVRSIDGAYGGEIFGALLMTDFLAVSRANGNAAMVSRSIVNTSFQNYGLDSRADNSTNLNIGVYGEAHDANASSNSAGIYGRGISDFGGSIWAGFFDGWVHVTGGSSAGSKAFKIDDPTDPTNRTLMHACVESDEHKNVYDGVATTDGSGNATVTLPDWFSALNKDFRYQLTVIGQFAQAIIASEIANHQFSIASDKPNVKVSWQVTGVRKDPYALAHPVEVQRAKPDNQRGKYLHPKEYGVSEELGVNYSAYREMEAQSEVQMKEVEAQRSSAAKQ